MAGAASWSFNESDFKQIQTHLQAYLRESNARCALLVDRNGQLVATVGETPQFDPTAFASLTAADFSANDQLAKMIGEPEFASLVHQGERESMFLADVAKRVILVVLFDQRAPALGLFQEGNEVLGDLAMIVFRDRPGACAGHTGPVWPKAASIRRTTVSARRLSTGLRSHVT